MATTGLLALLDDITALLDDVALYSKIAAKKSAGVLGDDLALNAQQVSGVEARRELPVVWAVARGSQQADYRACSPCLERIPSWSRDAPADARGALSLL